MATSQRSLLGAVALTLAGCAYQPVLVPVPTRTQTEPLVDRYPARQTAYASIAWNAGGVLGPCVASETSEAPLPAGARGRVASELNMNPSATQQFMQMRTGARILCGYDNPLAKPFTFDNPAAPKPARGAAPLPSTPAFANVTVVNTGEYLVADKALQCRGTVVMVDPSSIKPGDTPPAFAQSSAVRQFGNISVPAGYAAPAGVVRNRFGHSMASSLACETVMDFSRQIPLAPAR